MRKRYKIVNLSLTQFAGATGLDIWSTDPQVLAWLESEVKKILPKCKTAAVNLAAGSLRYDAPQLDNNPSGWYYKIRLEKLDNRQDGIRAWLIRLLLDKCWEPYDGDQWLRFSEDVEE
jgi:hypothetical protein